MNIQSTLTSDTAFIIYELIIFAILVFFILRFRNQLKQLKADKEKMEYETKRQNLDDKLSNEKGGNQR